MKRFFSQFSKKLSQLFRRITKVEVSPVKPPAKMAEMTNLDKKLVFSLAKKRFPGWQQMQYIPQYLSTKERLIIRVLIGLILISLGLLLVRFYQRHVVYLPRVGGTYSEALVGQPSYINPVLAQNDVDRDISKLIYSGLFKYNQSLELVPDLAERYEISEDKKTYTIFLKKGVKWHNGNELLADDVVFTFQVIQDPDYNSPIAASFNGVVIERIDDHTISLTLPKPFSPFLSNLTIGILPGHIWNDIAPSNFRLAEYNTKPIGTGPYIFKELTKDRNGTIKAYTLERYEDYHERAAYIEKIIFRFYTDFESAIGALKSNNVNGISYIPKNLKESVASNTNIITHSLQLPQYTAIFLNQKIDIFTNENVSKALSLATNKDKILTEALKGHGVIVHAPILEGFLGYHPEVIKFDYDPARAIEVLEEQDWLVPEGETIRKKGDAELKFSLTTVDQPEYIKTANIIKENWEAINVGVELKIMNPLRVDKEVIKPRNYEAFLYGEILGSDPDPFPFWHSSQTFNGGLNLSNYYNKDVDTLLEEARQIDNVEERTLKYIHFQNLLADDAPAIFLYSPFYDYGVTDKVKGLETKHITVPSDRLNGIEEWYIKTKLGWE